MAVLNTKTYRKLSWSRTFQRYNKKYVAGLGGIICFLVALFWLDLLGDMTGGSTTTTPILTGASPQPSITVPRIWVSLIISLEYERELMPHTLRHYIQTLQVPPSQLLVALHHQDGDQKTQLFQEMEAHLKQEYGIVHTHRWMGVYTSNDKWRTRGSLRDLVNVQPCDWIVNSDADELLQVPGNNLQTFLNMVSFQGYDVVYADFQGRVALQGELPEIVSNVPLSDQFPLSCRVTQSILPGADAFKAIAFYGSHRENRGGHYLLTTTNHTYEGRNEKKNVDHCGYPVRLHLDHYKWIRPVVAKLERRYKVYEELKMKMRGESKAFLDHIRTHGGRLGTSELNCTAHPEPVNYDDARHDVYVRGARCHNPATKCVFGAKTKV